LCVILLTREVQFPGKSAPEAMKFMIVGYFSIRNLDWLNEDIEHALYELKTPA